MVASLDTTGFPYGALTRYNLGHTYLRVQEIAGGPLFLGRQKEADSSRNR
jgi:hypothetical protein